MSSPTSILAIKALDGLSARAEATAHNIANANTPSYRPISVSFETALIEAAAQGPYAVSAVEPRIAAATSANGPVDTVRLDLEMETAAATQLRYSALVEMLSRQLLLHDLVLGGR